MILTFCFSMFLSVGAVVGGVVGYTAGEGIARSWGVSRQHRRPARKVRRPAD